MLRHSSDTEPGITRKRIKNGWGYFDSEGKRITDRDEIDRLNAIALPPAYGNAWFCKDANGHLQATGVDARGRKQYRYHADFRARRDKKKYTGTLEFGAALPKLRKKVEQDLTKPPLCREAVLAAVVRLLDTQYLRIGNEQYARENKSFGATTLRSRHLRREGGSFRSSGPGFSWQTRNRPRGTGHRPQPQTNRRQMPRPARPAPVPICGRGRRSLCGHVRRR